MDLQNGVQPQHTLLDRYADYLRSERSRTEPTVKAHREHVAAFLKDVGDSPTELSRQMSASYVLAFFTQRAQGKRLTMRRRLQGVLRSFLRFCFQKGYLDRKSSRFPTATGGRGMGGGGRQFVRSACGRVTVPGSASAARTAWSR